jgi:hypothetical protein
MSVEGISDERLEAAVEALGESERLREAEALVARAAPQLQRVLAQALESGGWFAEAHEDELRKTLDLPEAERAAALRTLLAEETRMGMMVGVAVGWALARELEGDAPEPPAPGG